MKKFLEQTAQSRTRAYDTLGEMAEQNLAITPSQMNKLASSNIPVSSSVLSQDVFDVGHDLGVNAPLSVFERRGVDFSEVSVYEQSCRNKVSDYLSSSDNNNV